MDHPGDTGAGDPLPNPDASPAIGRLSDLRCAGIGTPVALRATARPPEAAQKHWWMAWGSNPRPPHCERGALPTELAAQDDTTIGVD